MGIEICNTLAEIPAAHWDGLNPSANPFTSHAFLSALEDSGCIGAGTGWLPQFLLLRDDAGTLLAGLPMYEKRHSWGEYVFDWAWAQAAQRAGIAYYPKLVVAVPFSPVTGDRLLARDMNSREALIVAAGDHASRQGYSSLHWLFPRAAECRMLERHGLLTRHDVQFHWQNDAYRDFDEFLASLSSRKRKNIRRERRRVQEAGIVFRISSGIDLDEGKMDRMYQFYANTIARHGSHAYLNRAFFRLLAERLADNVVLVEALRDHQVIAAALNIRHGDTLYGRYWGCLDDYDSLHFETCYYQAIEYCIAQRAVRFEGGAQGEHKLSRGFLPQVTCSAHWFAEPALAQGVADFLQREKSHVEHYRTLLNEHSPFRKETATHGEHQAGD
jgi:predicted N-acyltransferase